MKIIHMSDLHLGKRISEISMLEDQRYILEEILQIIRREDPDAVIIAGDIYDRSMPPEEAVAHFDEFLSRLSQGRQQTMIISGNHDSAQRIAFGARLMEGSGIHISRVYRGPREPVALSDEYGPVYFWLLPFIKPVHVRRFHPELAADSDQYTEALRAAVQELDTDYSKRNVLVCHQFVTGAARSDSEEVSVGGLDNVDASVFQDFDYTALGHIHRPQTLGGGRIRYSGTPLKYSFSEAGDQKSLTRVILREKGDVEITEIPLTPLRDMREIRGSFASLTSMSYYKGTAADDYLHVTLTDEEYVPDAIGKMRSIYPNIMKLDYDNKRTGSSAEIEEPADAEDRTPLDLLDELYETQNGQPMGGEQRKLASDLIEEIWGKEL